MLNLSYFFYFVFAYKFEFYPVAFLGEKLHFTIETSFFWRDLFYTFLEVFLFLSAIYVYFFSLKSNRIYKNRSPFLIGSGGDSSTGKTTLQRLSSKLFQDDLLKIEGDGDHKWERGDARWDEYTHLNPKANWLHRQAEDLYALKNRKGIKRVDYDHKFGKFTKFYELQPKKFTLISSLHPFYLPASRSCLDLKIYMDPDEQLRKHWKIKRDVEKRGYTIAKVLEQMESRMADSSKYIHPQKNFADVVIAFFLKEPIKELGLDNELDLGLRVTLEASVHLDLLISSLDIPYIWDYTNDLKSQVIELQAAPVTIDYEKLSSEMVDNVEELALDAEFEEGYNGFIQLIILLSVSEKMKRNI
jgi:uridine kinase